MKIYTDASTRNNLSGVAFVITDEKNNLICKKAATVEESDNNTAELRAILFALAYTKSYDKHITLLTDSTYAINAIRNGHFRPHEKQIVDYILQNIKERKCYIMWIKGHCQDGTVLSYYNKQADKCAKKVRKIKENEIKKERKDKLHKLKEMHKTSKYVYKSSKER